MSRNISSNNTSSIGEDTPPVGKVLTTSDDISVGTPKQPRKKRTEAQKLHTDTLDALDIDTNVLHSGSILLRSHKTLLDTEEQAIRKQVEYGRLQDQEISLRPLRAGQVTEEKHLPTRQDFEYIYKHIDELDCQVWAPSPTPPGTPTDIEMATLKERSVFFPSDKFDGRNKNLTKQHWQTFEDFCDQQKLYITDRGPDATAANIDQIIPFFKMTLTDLARAWLERQTFTSAKELKEKFLTDFSPYGKTHRQWIAKWAELKFNPDIDNIDEFLEKFEDLAQLNNLRDDYKIHAFKMAMPKEIELHLRGIDNLQNCYQTAKDLLTIVQNPVIAKMSTLSLAQSRSPSPTHSRTRSPSPRNNRQTTNPSERS